MAPPHPHLRQGRVEQAVSLPVYGLHSSSTTPWSLAYLAGGPPTAPPARYEVGEAPLTPLGQRGAGHYILHTPSTSPTRTCVEKVNLR